MRKKTGRGSEALRRISESELDDVLGGAAGEGTGVNAAGEGTGVYAAGEGTGGK